MDSMRRETKYLQEKLKTKEKELEDSSKRNRKQVERETQGLRRQVSDLQRQLDVEWIAKIEAKAELDDALTRNRKQEEWETQSLRTQVWDLQRQLDVERIAKNEAKAELDDALTRLSAVTSSKLPDKNPNVADLSDQNRPSKLAEQLSELYDNEWTNAYEVLEDNMNDKECCAALLYILLAVYEECKQLSTVGFYERIQQSIESPVQSPVVINTKVQMSDYMKQQIKEIRKYRAKYALEAINKIVAPKIHAEKQETEEMKEYLKRCTDICWLMVVQDPPLVFTCGSSDKFDTAVFRSYTKRGSHVEFVVWPALLVNEVGSMLSKGIAQGYEEKKRPTYV